MFSKKSKLALRIVLPIFLAVASAKAQAASAAMMMSESASGDIPAETPIAPSKDPFKSIRQTVASGDWKAAQGAFASVAQSEQDNNLKALALVGAANAATHIGNNTDAQNYLTQAETLNSRIQDYVQYLLGISYQASGDSAKAKAKLNLVLNSHATPQMINEARFHLGEIALANNQLRDAQNHFQTLRSKMKNSDRYPQVVYHLMTIDRKLGRGQSCKWARELYSKYPSDPVTKNFKFDLQNTEIDGKKLGCSASRKDQEKRIRRLQWAGASEKALQELITIKNQTPESERYAVDSLIANHLIGEGQVDEALKLLLPYSQSQGNRTGYLLLLAKVASRADQPQAAVGAYEKAYKLAGRSKTGKTALFQAAFLSYQFQDYDGASRKFEDFVKLFNNSSLAKDAQWHLAWIRYLKGDYEGAMQKFSSLAATPKRRRRHGGGSGGETVEKARYWMAMSLLRLNRAPEARQIFQTLAKDAGVSYYSMLANYRLEDLPAATPPPSAPTNAAKPVLAVAKADETAAAPAAPADEETEEQLAKDTSEIDGAQTPDDEDTEEVADDSTENPDAPLGNSTFNDPYLSKRFERARDLSLIAMDDFARKELYEIERRTRSNSDRRTLMSEYQVVQSFHRSSYLGDVTFGMQRIRNGMKNGKVLWEFAYPRAYEKSVSSGSKNYSVPEEMIWGIMRAESHFNSDAQSPVGARGLMQLMPFTSLKVADLMQLKQFDVTTLLQPEVNIKLGSRYLSRLMQQFQGSLPLTAASYNAGPHRVQSWLKSFGLLDMDEFIEHIPFIETRNYVKRVMRNYQIYEILYGGGEAHRTMKWMVKPVNVKAVPSNEVW